jgi:hypothetical protein
MNCRIAKANFSSYIEQELSEVERRGVAAHLGRCPRCSSDLFAMQKAMSLLRWVPRVEGSPDFTRRLFERIHAEEKQPSPPSWFAPVLENWRRTWSDFAALLAAPAPVGAILAALVIGGGGGAFLVRAVPPAGTSQPPVVTAPSAPQPALEVANAGVLPREVETAQVAPQPPLAQAPAMATPQAVSGAAKSQSAARASGTSGGPAERRAGTGRSPRPAAPAAEEERGMEVAEWARGGQRLEGFREGPPSISRVEYILDRVDVNGRPVEAIPAGLQVQEGSVTF